VIRRFSPWLLVLWVGHLTGCTPAPVYQGIDMSAHNPVALAPVCVGQFALQFPRDGVASWHVNLDWAAVERLPARLHNATGFWAHVHARRDSLAAQPHDTEPSLLSHYEQVGENAALLLHRNIPVNKRVYYLERYLWLGDRGYLFKGLGEGEEIKAKLPAYKRIFSRLQPLNRLDQPGGFCIDGAVVNAEIKLRASLHARPAGMSNTSLVVGTVEAPDISSFAEFSGEDPRMFTPFGQLEIDQEQFSLLRSDPMIRDDPASPREFETLRKGGRAVAGREGHEVVWRKTTNNKVQLYRFFWRVSDARASVHGSPGLSLQMDSGDEMDPGAPPVSEEALLGLWDAVLDSVHKR